ncbi:MAG: S24 family peptidase [Bacteroidota bacterium]
MVAFDSYHTIPLVNMKDMDPYMRIEARKQFPLAGEAYHMVGLDLSQAIIKRPEDTFFIQVSNSKMIHEGLMQGDVVIVDRGVTPKKNALALVFFEGDFLIAKLGLHEDGLDLYLGGSEEEVISLEPEMNFFIWGIIIDTLHMNGKVLE